METPIRSSYISLMSNKVKQFGGINLAQGLPGFEPPAKLLKSLQESISLPIHQYPPATGNFKLVNHIQEEYARKFSPEKFMPLVTCGATEAISLLFNYIHLQLNEPYSVLSFNPAYESYSQLPNFYHVPFISFGNLDDTEIDFQQLETTIKEKKVKLIFVATIGNPYGKAFSTNEMALLIALSLRYNFFLIIDDVYSDLYFKQKSVLPFDQFHQNCFFVNSFSKRFSITGWRVGFLFAHQNHFHKIKNLHDYTGLCAPSLLQESIASYLSIPQEYQHYISSLRLNIAANFASFSEELTKLDFYIPPTDGGYFVWTKLPSNIQSGVDFSNQLYECQKVAVVPGVHFSDDAINWIRINIARPHYELKEGINAICKTINLKYS